MCDVEKFIDAYDEKQLIKKLLDDLTYFCDNYYTEESKYSYINQINDEITHENLKKQVM